MDYPVIVTVHLLCAIIFGGVVFFEVLLLEGVRKRLGDHLMERVEMAIIGRARRIMPFVVATLFLSGGYLAYTHLSATGVTWNNAFSVLLTVKILLALSVLAHFTTAMLSAHRGHMTSRRFQITHISVAIHILLIVILAKAMFQVSW